MEILEDRIVRLPGAAALGAFDGVHAGHRALLAAMSAGGSRTVVTWEARSPCLSTAREKELLFAGLGVDTLVFLPGVRSLPEALEALEPTLDGAALWCGEDDLPVYLRKGLSPHTVPMLAPDGRPIQSRSVRSLLSGGDFEAACPLLGGGYLMAGPVVRGKGAGHRHGMPTANLGFGPEKLLPPEGVYAVEAEAAGQRLIGVTNVGRRPSDDDMPYVSVETLLVDFDGDLYGQELTLRFRSYLRPTRRFPGGLDQVRRQIRADAAEAVRRLTKS